MSTWRHTHNRRLFIEAQRRNNDVAANARRLAKCQRPRTSLGWPLRCSMRAVRLATAGRIERLDRNMKSGLVDGAYQRCVVLLTARALEADNADDRDNATSPALEAVKRSRPTLVLAAALADGCLARRRTCVAPRASSRRRGRRTRIPIWPDAYAHLAAWRLGARSARLVQSLAEKTPGIEGALAVESKAALDAQELRWRGGCSRCCDAEPARRC